MDPYDSDSSLEDSADYTDTGVLLGYASSEVIDDSVSHLGGWPTWLDNNTPPPGDFANCKVCNRPMHLLLELNGDLPEYFPDHERRLYVFGCSRKTCNRKAGSIRACRATRRVEVEVEERKPEEETTDKAEPEKEEKPRQDLGASLFGAGSLTGSVSSGNANPFSSGAPGNGNGNGNGHANPFSSPTPAPSTTTPTQQPLDKQQEQDLPETFAAKVRLTSSSPTNPKIPPPESESTPSTPWPPQSAFPPPYPHLYLDAEYETLSRPSSPELPANVTIENPDDEAGKGAGSAELKDAFESELDKTFIRFSARLGQNPEQVLRYEFRGEPLLYTLSDEVGKRLHHDHGHAVAGGKVAVQSSGGSKMPRCEYCGSERVFELQLAPHAISVLEEGREGVGLGPKAEPGMEWGSIILGVCGSDCAPGDVGGLGWREEWAGVQWEESVQGR